MRTFSSPFNLTRLQSLIYTASSSGNKLPLSRTMSSLTSTATAPAMKVGQTLVGARWDYRLTKPLEDGVHQSTVFKAEVLPRDGVISPIKWSAIRH